MPQDPQLQIRTMTPQDIPFGMQLKDLAGWNQLPIDWERFIDWEPQGCFIATWDAQPVGTAITINYEGRVGWVGMVLVAPDQRRKGIGKQLLMSCIDYLEAAGVAAVKLDATPMGKQLYDTIGFVDEYPVERREGTGRPLGLQSGVEELTEDAMAQVLALDLRAFGADRSRVLRRLASESPTTALVATGDQGVEGYLFVRPGMNAHYLGPWVAISREAADALLRHAMHLHAGTRLFMDIPLANAETAGAVGAHGFEVQRGLIRMFRGRNVAPGETMLVWGVAGPEIG